MNVTNILGNLLANSKPVDLPDNKTNENMPEKPGNALIQDEQLNDKQEKHMESDGSISKNKNPGKDQKSFSIVGKSGKSSDVRFSFLDKMIKKYDYYRNKQNQLSKLQKQHLKIKNQKQYLQSLLQSKTKKASSQKSRKSKKKHRDMAKNRKVVDKIAKQLEKLRKQQQQIMDAQSQLEKQMKHEDEFFGKMDKAAEKESHGQGVEFVQDTEGQVPTDVMNAVLDTPHKQLKKLKAQKNLLKLKKKIKLQEEEDERYLTPDEINAWNSNSFEDSPLKQEYSPMTSDYHSDTTVYDTRPSYHGGYDAMPSYHQEGTYGTNGGDYNGELTNQYNSMGNKYEIVHDYSDYNTGGARNSIEYLDKY